MTPIEELDAAAGRVKLQLAAASRLYRAVQYVLAYHIDCPGDTRRELQDAAVEYAKSK